MDVPETQLAVREDAPTALATGVEPLARPSLLPPDEDPVLVFLSRLAPGSRPTQARALRRIAGLAAGGGDPRLVAWERLRYQHTQAIRTALVESGYAHTTVNRMLSALKGVMKETWRLGFLDRESYARAVDIETVRGQRLPPGRELSSSETNALFAACIGPLGARDAAMLALGFGAGLRRSEIVGLDLDDFIDPPGAILVRQAKGGKDREVPLPSGATTAVRAWLDVRGDDDGPLLLPMLRGGRSVLRRMTGQAVLKALRSLAARVGMQRFTPHDMRRTFVSSLLGLGADVSTVARLVAHQNVQTTCGYDRRGAEAARSAVGLLHIPYQGASS